MMESSLFENLRGSFLENLLKNDGDFVIFTTYEWDDPMVGVKWNNEIEKCLPLEIDGKYCFGDKRFASFDELIRHHYYNKIPLSSELAPRLLNLVKPTSSILPSSNIKLQEELINAKGYKSFIVEIQQEMAFMKKAVQQLENVKVQEMTIKEFNNIRYISHDNVVRFIGMIKGNNLRPTYFSEYQSGLNLRQEMSTMQNISEFRRLQIIVDVGRALYYLNTKQIIHIKVAPTEVFAACECETKQVRYRLGGPEWFRVDIVSKRAINVAAMPPVKYLSPEALEDEVFSKFSVIWNLAIFVWQVWNNGVEPFGNAEEAEIQEAIRKMKLPKVDNTQMHPCLQEIVKRCWQEKPNDRPFIDEVLFKFEKMKCYIEKKMSSS